VAENKSINYPEYAITEMKNYLCIIEKFLEIF